VEGIQDMKNKKKRNKKYVPPKQEERKPVLPTANAKMIYDLMKEKKARGKYKDHVIIVGSRIIDWLDTYEMAITNEFGVKSYGVDGIALVHKSKLSKLIGEEAAKKFWDGGVRVNTGVERRRVGCRVKDAVNNRP
jgi:hypothetical protein